MCAPFKYAKGKSEHPLTTAFISLQKIYRGRDVTIFEIRETLGQEGTPALIILLALPFCLPISIPILSIPFGLSIVFLGRRMLDGQPPQLPQKIGERVISAAHFDKLINLTIRWWIRIEKVVHRRFHLIGRARWLKTCSAWLIILNALILCLPLPIPLSNTLPALAIVGFSLATIEEDGLCFIFSAAISLLGAGYIVSFVLLGKIAFLRYFGII